MYKLVMSFRASTFYSEVGTAAGAFTTRTFCSALESELEPGDLLYEPETEPSRKNGVRGDISSKLLFLVGMDGTSDVIYG